MEWVTRVDIWAIQHSGTTAISNGWSNIRNAWAQHLNCRRPNDTVTIYRLALWSYNQDLVQTSNCFKWSRWWLTLAVIPVVEVGHSCHNMILSPPMKYFHFKKIFCCWQIVSQCCCVFFTRGAQRCWPVYLYKLQTAVRECDRRLCQWRGVNVRRLPIQPLIHSRGRSLPKVFLGYVWVWEGRPLLSGHLRLDRKTLVITKYFGPLPIIEFHVVWSGFP